MFIYTFSIFLASTAFVDTNAKYGISLSRYTVFLKKSPLGYSPMGAPAGILRLILLEISAIQALPLSLGCLARETGRNVTNPIRLWRAKFDTHSDTKKESTATGALFFGAPAGTRIPDTLIKSQVLYRLSYRGI